MGDVAGDSRCKRRDDASRNLFTTIAQGSMITYWEVLTWLCRLSGSSRPRWTMQEGQVTQQAILRCII
jgi:hypothetical protein